MAFPIIFPPEPIIEPMAVLPDVRVKFPEVNVTEASESVNAARVLFPNTTPPAPFKVKLGGYSMKVLLSKVIAEPFVNIKDPVPPIITPVVRVIAPLSDNVPELIFNNPVDKFIPPVEVKVKELKFKVREFKANVPFTSMLDPNVTFAEPVNVKLFTALLVPGVVWFINKVLVVLPKNTNVAVAFPTIFPPDPVIEPMAVVKIPGLRVKFPEVMVNARRESVNVPPVVPPKVTPPAPFKIKLAGYLLKVFSGKVTALILVNLTVPPGAEICPVTRDTAPPMLNIPVETFIVPDVITNDPTDNVPDPKVNVPELMLVYAPLTIKVPVLN